MRLPCPDSLQRVLAPFRDFAEMGYYDYPNLIGTLFSRPSLSSFGLFWIVLDLS